MPRKTSLGEEEKRLPRGWRRELSRTKQRYFYINEFTSETQWDPPTGPAVVPPVHELASMPGIKMKYQRLGEGEDAERFVTTNNALLSPPTGAEKRRPFRFGRTIPVDETEDKEDQFTTSYQSLHGSVVKAQQQQQQGPAQVAMTKMRKKTHENARGEVQTIPLDAQTTYRAMMVAKPIPPRTKRTTSRIETGPFNAHTSYKSQFKKWHFLPPATPNKGGDITPRPPRSPRPASTRSSCATPRNVNTEGEEETQDDVDTLSIWTDESQDYGYNPKKNRELAQQRYVERAKPMVPGYLKESAAQQGVKLDTTTGYNATYKRSTTPPWRATRYGNTVPQNSAQRILGVAPCNTKPC
eukprot:TRINITY_DN67149_c1_g5_i1.p1 TRINITY_DN67149_c1_g5~~TRINITY_DN67149_c1_g5_i1.p1  ORF type:complete len:354 (-),score=41.73 TRINITY_DN67149_c1_g5_i1:1672-2733(-)